MKHLKTATCTFALLALASCSKNGTGSAEGQLRFSVEPVVEVADITRSNVSDFTTLPAAGDFTLKITDSESVSVWTGKLSEWNSSTGLPAGNYSVSASYSSADVEGFDKPYFTGTKSFAIEGGSTATVSIPVSLGNTVIRINCTEAFRNYFKDYSFTISRDGAEVVSFAKDETKAAFVDGYKFTLSGTMTGELKEQTFSKDYSNLNPATAYTVNFDVPNAGGGSIIITFNDETETVELGDVELND